MNSTPLDKIGRFFRSMGVGAIATVVDLLALVVLVELVGLAPLAANVPALLLGLAVQFFGNKYFAFRDHSRNLAKQGLQFALIEVGALVLNGLAFHIAASLALLPYVLLRMLCSAGVYVGYSFPLWGLVFRERSALDDRNADDRTTSHKLGARLVPRQLGSSLARLGGRNVELARRASAKRRAPSAERPLLET